MMKNDSQLKHGLIPKYTPCPYRVECGENGGNCMHKGENHQFAYSCAFARLFDLLHRNGHLDD